MIVAETEHIVLHFNNRSCDRLAVTFGHMDYTNPDTTFWGETVIDTIGYAGLGFVCRKNVWYPAREMAALIPRARAIADRFAIKLGYGFSMGAYASLKFSAALGLDESIALSPQFSIVPGDVLPFDARLVRHFKPHLNHGMKIVAADLGGRLYLFYDPYDPRDTWNVAQIAAVVPGGARYVPVSVPRIGHETIDLFAGRAFVDTLFKLAAAGDVKGLTTFTATRRRASGRRAFNVLQALAARSPRRASQILIKVAPRIGDYWTRQCADLLLPMIEAASKDPASP